jgi:hypothetical protein
MRDLGEVLAHFHDADVEIEIGPGPLSCDEKRH